MSFLQPWMLLALPLVALPVIIHLINQRRFQTMPWAAMMFLLAANRMSRGYARLRQWLILLFRMLAIAGLLFVISRPLASGWLGATAGGGADATIVILDRSPSMQQIGTGSNSSKLDTARRQLSDALATLGTSRLVLIDSGDSSARELDSIEAISDATDTGPAGNTADLAGMLKTAYDYVKANRVGRADVWIVSDLRESDWESGSGRWDALRDNFASLPQTTKFHLLAYSEPTAQNRSIRVTNVRRQQQGDTTNLLVSLSLSGDENNTAEGEFPLQFEIEGARSETTIALTGGSAEIKDHPIPIDSQLVRGWGRVSIPADTNPADNDAYFVFAEPAPRKTILVSDDPETSRPLLLAAQISPDPNVAATAETFNRDQLATIPWEEVALLVWQGDLPSAAEQKPIDAFVQAGGQVLFFPPKTIGAQQAYGVSWQPWISDAKGAEVSNWRGDEDLLANTISGASLPVGKLKIHRYAGLSGEYTPLASLDEEHPLLVRANRFAEDSAGNRDTAQLSGPPGIYFCTTTPNPGDSTLARDGVVLYVAIQRAILRGSEALGDTRSLDAGASEAVDWRAVSVNEDAISSQYGIQPGIYQTSQKLLAVNRSKAEDSATLVSDQKLESLFQGLDFSRVDDQAGSLRSLVNEVWRLFLIIMIVAMIVEAALCLPQKRTANEGAATL